MLLYECLTKLDNCEAGVYLLIISWMTELDDTKSCYQLIKTMTKSEKECRYWLIYIFVKNN